MIAKVIHFLLLLVFISVAMGQPGKHSAAMQTARKLMQNNQLDKAQVIYEDLLVQNPKNSHVYLQLKTIYRRQENYLKLQNLISKHLEQFPNDLQSHVDLGEVIFLQKDENEALKYWSKAERRYANNSQFYRLLVNSFGRLNLTREMEALLKRGRIQLKNPTFLALNAAQFYQSRLEFSKAINEYLLLAKYQPAKSDLVITRILQMSDDPENLDVIRNTLENHKDRKEPHTQSVLAAFYFKTGEMELAFLQHRILGMADDNDMQRWLDFANALRLEKQYEIAIRAYELILLNPSMNQDIIGTGLIGLGQTFEDQIIPVDNDKQIVRYFNDNIFFKSDFQTHPRIKQTSLDKAFRLYDSVLVELPESMFSAQAHYRLGEIRFKITKDYEGAMQSYRAAFGSAASQKLRQKIKLRIGDVMIAMGELQNASKYYQQIQLENELFRNKYIQTLLISGETDSTLALLNIALTESSPSSKYYNDLMELRDLFQTHYSNSNEDGKKAFKLYLFIELLIYQQKLTEAAESLSILRNMYPDISLIPVLVYREAIIRISLGQNQIALELTSNLDQTILSDIGLIIQGMIYENINQQEQALNAYHAVLEKYPESIYFEPVRFHARELALQSQD